MQCGPKARTPAYAATWINRDMFEADAEMAKLKYLPGIDDMTERYRTHVQGVAESYRSAGLANALKKEEQVGDGRNGSKIERSQPRYRWLRLINLFNRRR